MPAKDGATSPTAFARIIGHVSNYPREVLDLLVSPSFAGMAASPANGLTFLSGLRACKCSALQA
jgi:hypothetical protein